VLFLMKLTVFVEERVFVVLVVVVELKSAIQKQAIKPVRTMGMPPCKRAYHGSTTIADTMFIFGGYNYKKYAGTDLYAFSANRKEWTVVPVAEGSALPMSRSAFGFFSFEKTLYIVGGHFWEVTFQGIWEYSLKTRLWKSM